jgi:O-antigen biosynthesis protein
MQNYPGNDLKMELSIIIVNYNVRDYLEQCLLSVRKASENINCEIFVVDNNSADGSCSMVKRTFPEVRLIRNIRNNGFAVANNQAIKMATGKFILLLNPDTIVEEDTFRKCTIFMNEHPDAGSIGVKMINGRGKYLPESKRALPTPKIAFFKIFGFSSIFPKSERFNKYYLGHLDQDETNIVEILTGAFMFIRKEALDIAGLLDERFFMYGEDIDLSYRLIKTGFKNYYYPDVTIIHYKGQSTKKGNINYIINFYRAMLIFLMKHFTGETQKKYFVFIKIAIWFRALLSLLKRFINLIILPFLDAAILYLFYQLLIDFWQEYRFGNQYVYPGIFTKLIVPAYILCWVISIASFGGYRKLSRINRLLYGTVFGTAFILVVYALIPDEIRFSRSLVIFGGISATIILSIFRYLLLFAGFEVIPNPFTKSIRTIIVGNEVDYNYLTNQITKTFRHYEVIGRVSISPDDLGNNSLGDIMQMKEIVKFNRISNVIYSTGELNASQIISSMVQLSNVNIEIKIAPMKGNYFIGESTKKQPGEIVPIDLLDFRFRKKCKRSF